MKFQWPAGVILEPVSYNRQQHPVRGAWPCRQEASPHAQLSNKLCGGCAHPFPSTYFFIYKTGPIPVPLSLFCGHDYINYHSFRDLDDAVNNLFGWVSLKEIEFKYQYTKQLRYGGEKNDLFIYTNVHTHIFYSLKKSYFFLFPL